MRRIAELARNGQFCNFFLKTDTIGVRPWSVGLWIGSRLDITLPTPAQRLKSGNLIIDKRRIH